MKLKLEDGKKKIELLTQEKEHLRHKVIRLNLNARGEGANTIENMVKRITRETAKLHSEFENVTSQYDQLFSENQQASKKLKEQTKLVAFLEKEIAKRNAEYQSMTRTFEEFLSGRARQARRDRSKKLLKLHEETASGLAGVGQESAGTSRIILDSKAVVRAEIPSRGVCFKLMR